MKHFTKLCLLGLCMCSLLTLYGCGSKQKETKETYTLQTNSVYEAPTHPTQEQIREYNELSNAIQNNADSKKMAELVAVNFAYEFFTLKEKTGKEDVGGLTFIPKEKQEEFKDYAVYKYYNNYQAVLSQYSKDDLPSVILHEVNQVTPSSLMYNQATYDGYIVSLTLKYEESKLPSDGLKTVMKVSVIEIDNISYVIAVEDQ
ncbi:MAG: hypothetical protein HFF01_06365 [Erysipelotrichaceae bacterium]|nr:hypothetical protein [Erysipelotrichaceae bacterium]